MTATQPLPTDAVPLDKGAVPAIAAPSFSTAGVSELLVGRSAERDEWKELGYDR